MKQNLELLQKNYGYFFNNIELLKTALTHSSYINESNRKEHNERLEFLGDAVLEIHISEALYHRFPNSREGALTHMRSTIVNEKSLAEKAKKLGIPENLFLGTGEEQQGGRKRPALIADAFEAILGAIYLDSNFEITKKVINMLFQENFPKEEKKTQQKSYKTLLQEFTQAHFKYTPEYEHIGSSGPEHSKKFTVRYTSPKGFIITAEGSSIKKAEHEVAKLALQQYKKILQAKISK